MKFLTVAILALSLPTVVLADELRWREPELKELSVEMPAKLILVMSDSYRKLSGMTNNPRCYFVTVDVGRDVIAVTYHSLSLEEQLSKLKWPDDVKGDVLGGLRTRREGLADKLDAYPEDAAGARS